MPSIRGGGGPASGQVRAPARLAAWGATVLLAACSPGPTEGPAGQDDCFRPLESYCARWPCPGFEQSVADVRAFGTNPPGACFVARVGRCGELSFTSRGLGFGVTTLYFDSTGVLVAVYETTDVWDSRSSCPNWKHYGRRVSCSETEIQDYCRR
jgi:hypothetical protein